MLACLLCLMLTSFSITIISLSHFSVRQVFRSHLLTHSLTQLFYSFISLNITKFSEPPSYYANLYRKHNLTGAHVIKLGPGNDDAAKECLRTWPGNSFPLSLSIYKKKHLNSLTDIRDNAGAIYFFSCLY
jgi:hypothetical protein